MSNRCAFEAPGERFLGKLPYALGSTVLPKGGGVHRDEGSFVDADHPATGVLFRL